MASLGTHVPIDCPACPDQVDVPVRQVGTGSVVPVGDGTDDFVITVEVDLRLWREHVTTVHAANGRGAL